MLGITFTPQKSCKVSSNRSISFTSNQFVLKNQPVQDTFVKAKNLTISFRSTERQFFSENPVIKDSVDRVVYGYSAAVEHLNNLVKSNGLEQKDVKVINKHLSKELLESAYNFPSAEKAASLIKLGGVGAVMSNRCASFASMKKADYSIIGTGKRSSERKYDQTGQLMKEIFGINDPELSKFAKRQAKVALLEVLTPGFSQFARREALQIMSDQQLFTCKSDVELVIDEINNLGNESETVRLAVKILPEAINSYLVAKNEPDNAEMRDTIVEALTSLNQLKMDEYTSHKTKLICTSAVTKILTNNNIPKTIRTSLINSYYNS